MQKWWNWLFAILILCLLFVAIPLTLSKDKSVQELKPMFDTYIQKFNKSYGSPEEYDTRFRHFVASMREIDKLNAESTGPDHLRAKYGLTKLSDMSPTEYREIHLSDERLHKHPSMYGKSRHRSKDVDSSKHDIDAESKENRRHGHSNNVFNRKKRALMPLQVDWRTKGVVGPVRNQGLCGACWAFSTIGTMEAMAAIKTGVLDTLSVQEAIDCAGLGNKGCAGGDICLLLDWLYITQTPVQKDKEYPLRNINGVCKTKTNNTGVYVRTFTCDDFVGEEDQILQSIATHGPVTVAVNALTWQNYLGGVIQFHCSGAPADLNHAVELVGYDLTAEIPHYIVKNSWGKDFGINGYLNLAIGSNICGLANEVASIDVK